MNSSDDFFAGLTSGNPVRTISLTFSGLVCLVVPAFIFSIIWFERFGSDKKRTLLNIIASFGCWTGIEYIYVIQTSEIFRYIHGPLPPSFCFFLRIFRSALFLELLLLFDTVTISKYFYIFWLKNPAGFNDDFWSIFLNVWIKGFSFLSQTVWHYFVNQQPMSFYICTGQDPTPFLKHPLRFVIVYFF
jgi:hypothetical protein